MRMTVSRVYVGDASTWSTIFLTKPSNRSSFEEDGRPSTYPLGLTKEPRAACRLRYLNTGSPYPGYAPRVRFDYAACCERERACHRCASGVNKQLKCPAMFRFLRGL